jgi:hypothetical protein
MRPFRRTAQLALVALACFACGRSPRRVGTTARVAGEYVVVERDGGRLPHRMPSVDGRCQTELVRDVLTLRADGSADEAVEARVWCGGEPRPDTTSVASASGRFVVRGARGDSITVTTNATEPPGVMKGAIVGDELRMRYVRPPGLPTLTFRYVRQRD